MCIPGQQLKASRTTSLTKEMSLLARQAAAGERAPILGLFSERSSGAAHVPVHLVSPSFTHARSFHGLRL